MTFPKNVLNIRMSQSEKEESAKSKFKIAQAALARSMQTVRGLKAVAYERDYAAAYQGLVKLGLAPQIKKKYRTF